LNDLAKNVILWIVIAVVLLSVFNSFGPSSQRVPVVEYSQFLNNVKDGSVERVEFDGNAIRGRRRSNETFITYNPETDNSPLITLLVDHNVAISAAPPKQQSFLLQLFISSFPILLLIAVWVYFMRQMQGAGGGRGAMSFGKSRARLLGEDQVSVTFADVAGVEEAKEEVVEIVDFLKDPAKFQRLGARSPRACSWSARLAPARRCSHVRSPAKPRCRSSRSRLRLRRDVRRRRRLARSRHVRSGQEARAVHHLHR
jgi:cell division protease FtsH